MGSRESTVEVRDRVEMVLNSGEMAVGGGGGVSLALLCAVPMGALIGMGLDEVYSVGAEGVVIETLESEEPSHRAGGLVDVEWR